MDVVVDPIDLVGVDLEVITGDEEAEDRVSRELPAATHAGRATIPVMHPAGRDPQLRGRVPVKALITSGSPRTRS